MQVRSKPDCEQVVGGLDYRTVILSVDDEQVVGAAAVLVGEGHTPLREGLVRSLARRMIEKDDVTATATALGPDLTSLQQ